MGNGVSSGADAEKLYLCTEGTSVSAAILTFKPLSPDNAPLPGKRGGFPRHTPDGRCRRRPRVASQSGVDAVYLASVPQHKSI